MSPFLSWARVSVLGAGIVLAGLTTAFVFPTAAHADGATVSAKLTVLGGVVVGGVVVLPVSTPTPISICNNNIAIGLVGVPVLGGGICIKGGG